METWKEMLGNEKRLERRKKRRKVGGISENEEELDEATGLEWLGTRSAQPISTQDFTEEEEARGFCVTQKRRLEMKHKMKMTTID